MLAPYGVALTHGCITSRLRRLSYAKDWQIVIVATPTMSSAEHPRERSLTGFATP